MPLNCCCVRALLPMTLANASPSESRTDLVEGASAAEASAADAAAAADADADSDDGGGATNDCGGTAGSIGGDCDVMSGLRP